MTTIIRRTVAAALPLATVGAASDGPARVTATFRPALATVDGRPLLRHELRLSNDGSDALTLRQLDVVDATSGAVLATLGARDLAAATVHDAGGRAGATPLVLPANTRAAIYLDVPLDGRRIPRRVRHRLKLADGRIVRDTPIGLDQTPSPVLAPPLRGGPYAAVYDPANEMGHRRFSYTVDGVTRVPGRFAIDWFPLPGGPGVGAPVIAVADATVVAMRGDVPQPAGDGATPRGEAAGNHVILDLGHGRYAHYEHLLPDPRVRVGQRVRRGQQVGRLGATGQVSGAHLHFHVSDGPGGVASEGQPYRLTGAWTIGSYRSINAAVTGGPPRRTPARTVVGLPPPNAVLMFEPASSTKLPIPS